MITPTPAGRLFAFRCTSDGNLPCSPGPSPTTLFAPHEWKRGHKEAMSPPRSPVTYRSPTATSLSAAPQPEAPLKDTSIVPPVLGRRSSSARRSLRVSRQGSVRRPLTNAPPVVLDPDHDSQAHIPGDGGEALSTDQLLVPRLTIDTLTSGDRGHTLPSGDSGQTTRKPPMSSILSATTSMYYSYTSTSSTSADSLTISSSSSSSAYFYSPTSSLALSDECFMSPLMYNPPAPPSGFLSATSYTNSQQGVRRSRSLRLTTHGAPSSTLVRRKTAVHKSRLQVPSSELHLPSQRFIGFDPVMTLPSPSINMSSSSMDGDNEDVGEDKHQRKHRVANGQQPQHSKAENVSTVSLQYGTTLGQSASEPNQTIQSESLASEHLYRIQNGPRATPLDERLTFGVTALSPTPTHDIHLQTISHPGTQQTSTLQLPTLYRHKPTNTDRTITLRLPSMRSPIKNYPTAITKCRYRNSLRSNPSSTTAFAAQQHGWAQQLPQIQRTQDPKTGDRLPIRQGLVRRAVISRNRFMQVNPAQARWKYQPLLASTSENTTLESTSTRNALNEYTIPEETERSKPNAEKRVDSKEPRGTPFGISTHPKTLAQPTNSLPTPHPSFGRRPSFKDSMAWPQTPSPHHRQSLPFDSLDVYPVHTSTNFQHSAGTLHHPNTLQKPVCIPTQTQPTWVHQKTVERQGASSKPTIRYSKSLDTLRTKSSCLESRENFAANDSWHQRVRKCHSSECVALCTAQSLDRPTLLSMDLQTRRMTKPGIKDYRLSDIRTVPTTATTAKPRRASLCHLNHPRVTPCPIKALLDLNPVSQYRPPRHGEEPGVDPLHKSLRTSRSCAKPISARDSLGRSGSISASTRASGHTHRPYRGAGAEPGPQGNVSILAARHGVIGTSETLPMSSTWGIDFRGPTPGLPFGGVTHRVSDAGETKRFEKRSHALRELETTEESYVNDLDILINIHLRVLESKAWFPPVLHGNIIRCARGLLVIQQKFLSHLADNKLSMMEEEKKAPLVVYKRLCEAFEGLSQERAIYSTFCELRMRILATIERSAVTVMAQFKKECGEMMTAQGRPRSRYELKDYLIKPIQRVCRYPLLLKEVLRLTDSSDPEYRYIERAHRTMKDMAQDIDDTQRSVERLLLTERLLKKLPETSFPRKLVFSSGPSQTNGTNGSGLHAQNNSVSSTQPMNMGTRNNSSDFKPLHHSSEFQSNGGNTSVSSKSTGIQETSLLRGSGSGGIVPSALTRAFMGTLGSIVLAGTLECILIPNDPVRFKYYGCFLFESMIVIVKAKKSNLYEPRQWLPLRLCELQEQKRSEGHTQFGWRVVFDRFRIEFGASSTAEQQIWVKTLRERIQASKEAYASLPRDIAAFETLVSSLPWRTSKPQCLSCQLAKNILYQPPSPSPSPWSLSSSSIPSPLMPPPPSGISSTTLMMAMPYDPALESDQHGAIRTTTLVEGCSCSHHESGPWDSLKEISMGLHREKRPHSVKHLSSGYKEGRGIGGMANCGDRANDDHSENPGLLRRSHSQPQAPNDHRAFPDSTQYYQLQPSNSVPWLMPDSRHRNGFDVSKVFASGHAAIKPNHRALVQTMFKDLSAEAIWTTSADSLPAPPPALAASPLVRRPSKYGGSAQSLNYAPPTNTSAPLSTKATGSRSSVLAGMAGFPMAAASPDHDGSNTDMTGSSLSSKLLRHKDYGSGTRLYVNTIVEVPDNAECDRKKMSATASIAATLASSFRKHSEAPNRGSGKGCGDMNYPQSTAKSQEHKSGLGSKFSTTAKSTDKRTLSSDNIASSQFSDGLGSTSTEPSIIKSSQSCKELRSLVVDTTPGKTSRLCSLDNDDTLTSLNSAAEAAKSRRGTGERGAKRSPGGTDSPTKLLVSSTSLPLSVKSDDLNTIQDFTPSTPPAEVALSRQYPDKIEKRRSDGFLDRSATGYHHSNNSYPALPSLQQVSSPRSTDNMTSSNPRQVPGERQCSRYGLSKFKETIDSNGLPVDGPMSASAPNTGSMSGWRWCPQYNTPPSRASHSRTTSSCTERSMGLEFNPASSHEDKIGRQRLSMTPSASVTSCSSSSLYCPSPRSLSYSSPSPQRNLQRTMDNVNAIQTKVEPGPNSAVHRDLDFAADRNSKAAHSPTLSDQQRRKSLAILQNITHSASQKIKSLIRTPAGLRRKSAMSISPLVMMDTSASTPLASLAFESQIESCPVEREGGYPDLVLQLQHQHHKMPESAKLIFKSSHIDDRKNEPVVPTEKGRISSPIEQSDGRSDSLAL